MTWSNKDMLAAVGATTIVAAALGAEALGPFACALLGACGGVLLTLRAIERVAIGRRLRKRDLEHEQQLRHRDERLAQTAHELRTPLAAMMNSLEIVRSGMAETKEDVDRFLEEAELAAQHLAFLMNDVLDAASIKAGKLRLEVARHGIGQLILDSTRMLGMLATRNPITIRQEDGDVGLAVRTDARRLLQVLFNLVSNAIKHSESGQPIEISIRGEGDQVRFRVLDEGHGVAEHVRPQLFSPFAGDERNARADSTGLGLMICRDLIEQMDGTIGYAPRPTGSEFWFTQPRAGKVTVAPAEPVTR